MVMWVLALLAAADRPVVVSSLTAGQLVDYCRARDGDPGATLCTGYIIGAFDGLSLSHQICPTAARASNLEVAAIVRTYLRRHRAKASAAPVFLVRDALRAAFPCQRT